MFILVSLRSALKIPTSNSVLVIFGTNFLLFVDKDAAAACKKVWNKVRTKSNSSSKLASALSGEKEGKEEAEEERIEDAEDVIHEHIEEEETGFIKSENEQDRHFLVGHSMSDRGSSVDSMSVDEPSTPPESVLDISTLSLSNKQQGKTLETHSLLPIAL